MKWNGLGRGFKAAGVSLAVGLGMSACSRDYTLAYVYVSAATHGTTGQINEYAVDYQTGSLTPLAETSIPSGGNNPVALIASPNGKYLYAINNSAPSSNVVEFTIGTDGKLYGEKTTPIVQNASGTVVGSFPTAVAIDPTGSFLYVTFTYQAGFTTANPGPGGVAVYPLSATDGSLGAPVANGSLPYFQVGNNPVGIVIDPKAGNYVYVIDQEKPANAAAYGVLLAFQNKAGLLTQVPGPLNGGFAAGTTPAGIAEDPAGHFLYVTDETTNQLYGYGVQNSGTPAALQQSPFVTGSFPLGVTVDPRGEYVYVANFNSGTVSPFAINQANGSLSGIVGSGGTSASTGPTCVTIEPALGIYLYTSNNEDNTVSALQLSPNTGSLTPVQNTPYPTGALPTCAVSVANGAHATQIVH
jgi:6-phosphogluconolactonase